VNQIQKLSCTVDRYKAQLKKSPVVENFGQKHVRELKNEFPIYAGEDYQERQTIIGMVNEFDNWCMNYTGEVGK